jgi:hypothetical protein
MIFRSRNNIEISFYLYAISALEDHGNTYKLVRIDGCRAYKHPVKYTPTFSVEQWASENEKGPEVTASGLNIPDGASEDDRQRIVRLTADQIVADILQLAITHVLFQAEAGVDTAKSMAALKSIQVRGLFSAKLCVPPLRNSSQLLIPKSMIFYTIY